MYKASEDTSLRRLYYVKCGSCGKRTRGHNHLDDAIKVWNDTNKPTRAKPKYQCGCCGAEVTFGFETCPKCGAEVDWN